VRTVDVQVWLAASTMRSCDRQRAIDRGHRKSRMRDSVAGCAGAPRAHKGRTNSHIVCRLCMLHMLTHPLARSARYPLTRSQSALDSLDPLSLSHRRASTAVMTSLEESDSNATREFKTLYIPADESKPIEEWNIPYNNATEVSCLMDKLKPHFAKYGGRTTADRASASDDARLPSLRGSHSLSSLFVSCV
jgi:hypothetical protein